MGKLRLSKLSLPKVMELVKGRAETQREEVGFLNIQVSEHPEAAGYGEGEGWEFGCAVFLHGWWHYRPSLCHLTSGLESLSPPDPV